MEINSSYENINKLTNYNYISDDELRSKTKNFLFKQCGIYFSQTNVNKIKSNSNKGDRKSISSNEIIHIPNNKRHEKGRKKKSSLKAYKSFKVDQSPKFRFSMIKDHNYFKKINSTISEKQFSMENKLQKSKGTFKKNKNKKEMVMISNNMRQNSQNLQNPELFYTGLFNNIIEKQKKKSINSPDSPKFRKKRVNVNEKTKNNIK
jgi:hypothetical protein